MLKVIWLGDHIIYLENKRVIRIGPNWAKDKNENKVFLKILYLHLPVFV